MNIHKNARLTPLRREEMTRDVVEGRLSKADAARTYGVTAKVVARVDHANLQAQRLEMRLIGQELGSGDGSTCFRT
jgi:transposase-like protein